MSAIRSMLTRVQRLEQARRAPRSLIEASYGSLEAWEDQVRAEVEAGKLDRIDMLGADGNGGVLAAVARWHRERMFGMWQRQNVLELGRRESRREIGDRRLV